MNHPHHSVVILCDSSAPPISKWCFLMVQLYPHHSPHVLLLACKTPGTTMIICKPRLYHKTKALASD